MRKALVVGVNHYEKAKDLRGCVDDAYKVKSALEVHADGSPNFDVRPMTGTGPGDPVNRSELRAAVETLFAGGNEIDVALFYFAGHGFIDNTGGFLCTSDVKLGTDGVALHDVLAFANASQATNRVIILDSCHSGAAGQPGSRRRRT